MTTLEGNLVGRKTNYSLRNQPMCNDNKILVITRGDAKVEGWAEQGDNGHDEEPQQTTEKDKKREQNQHGDQI